MLYKKYIYANLFILCHYKTPVTVILSGTKWSEKPSFASSPTMSVEGRRQSTFDFTNYPFNTINFSIFTKIDLSGFYNVKLVKIQ